MLKIVYEHADFWVVHKPLTQSFHCQGEQLGVFEAFKQQQGVTELYPVHRLDTVTTGLLLFAKTATVAARLGALFESHAIEKYYLAISNQKPKKKQGAVMGDMAAARRGSYKLLRSKDNPAITQFFSHSTHNAECPAQRLFLLKPRTGKTHQLRVMMKSIGAPILGDARYSGDAAKRTHLHAYQIGFDWQGERVQYQCLPADGVFADNKVQALIAQEWASPQELSWPTRG